MPAKMMHIAQFLMHAPTYHSLAMWRHPRTAAAGWDWTRPQLYQHIARVCERGRFDMVFFADLNYISDTYRHSLEPALRYAAQAPEHDPIPLLSYMAAATSHIGVASTFSVSQHHPFYAARLWATLDHLTEGRAGWNVVTSINHNQDANFGVDRPPADVVLDLAHGHVLPRHHPAAIHVDHLTGDVPGPVRSQEQDGFGDLLRLAETLQRIHGDRLVDVLGRDSPLGLPLA